MKGAVAVGARVEVHEGMGARWASLRSTATYRVVTSGCGRGAWCRSPASAYRSNVSLKKRCMSRQERSSARFW